MDEEVCISYTPIKLYSVKYARLYSGFSVSVLTGLPNIARSRSLESGQVQSFPRSATPFPTCCVLDGLGFGLPRDREGMKKEHTQSRVQNGFGQAECAHSEGAAATWNLSTVITYSTAGEGGS